MIAIAGVASRVAMSCPVVDMGRPRWMGRPSQHVRSVRAQSVRWRTAHARRAHFWARGEQFYVQTPVRSGGSQRHRSARWGRVSASSPWECVAMRAAPVSVPMMGVQVGDPSAVWTDRTALAPSPTAEATRFSEVRRTSPAANGGHAGFKRQWCAPQRCPGSRPTRRSVSSATTPIRPRVSRRARSDVRSILRPENHRVLGFTARNGAAPV
jgi:hypothetical protein